MLIVLVVCALYLIIGIFMIIRDFLQPYANRPSYVHDKNAAMAFLKIILWPLLR